MRLAVHYIYSYLYCMLILLLLLLYVYIRIYTYFCNMKPKIVYNIIYKYIYNIYIQDGERERAVIPPAFTDEVTLSRLMSDALYWPPPIQLINHSCGHYHARGTIKALTLHLCAVVP